MKPVINFMMGLFFHRNQERWTAVANMRSNELAAEAGKNGPEEVDSESDGELDESKALRNCRQPPHLHKEKSPAYWRAVANKHVRTYISFVEEGKSDSAFVQQVCDSNVANIQPELSKNTVLLHCDTSLLGESPGPGCQPGLRAKKWKPVLRKNSFNFDTFFQRDSKNTVASLDSPLFPFNVFNI